MIRIIICVFSVSLISNCNAQFWVNSNPIWYYQYSKGGLDPSYGEFKITNIGDSTIAGKSCQMLQQEKSIWYNSGNVGYYIGTNIYDTNYVYIEGDTVFYYQSEQFRILYNFNSNVGDSWLVHVTETSSNCEDSSFVIVSETGLINISGLNYRYIKLQTIGNPDYQLNGVFIERFGKYSAPSTIEYDHGSLFPYSSCQSEYEFTYFTLNCFSDDLLNYQVFTNCFSNPATSLINEINSNFINIYPNPFQDYFRIEELKEISSIQILDVLGECLCNFESIDELNHHNFSDLKSGVYLLKVISNELLITKTLLKL